MLLNSIIELTILDKLNYLVFFFLSKSLFCSIKNIEFKCFINITKKKQKQKINGVTAVLLDNDSSTGLLYN